MKRFKLAGIILFICIFSLCICIYATVILMKTPPSEIFSRYVLNPIPESVTNIKVDRPKKVWGYLYTFRFDINKEDLDLIINSKPLKRVWNVKYIDGFLEWEWDPKHSLSLPVYAHWGAFEPLWFRPEKLGPTESYAYDKEEGQTNVQVLLYNQKKGQAYFIAYSPSH
ncbi:MAG: hypothetical protein JW715_09365 [Sedimentisphaerales bacterium]|nr:hypothetical protein [Sedimentisphaerales bacterium]